FIFSTGDENGTEFPAPFSNRLACLTGFTGSTGAAAILADAAAMFVVGRYAEAVRNEVDARDYMFHKLPGTTPAAWVAAYVGDGARIGYDPRLVMKAGARAVEETLAATGARLVPLEANPIDTLWSEQPPRPATAVFIH